MKFISTNIIDARRLAIDIPFDSELIENIKSDSDSDNVLTFTYNLADTKTEFLENVTEAFFVTKLTHDNIYLSAIIYIDDEDIPVSPFVVDGMIDCNVKTSNRETNSLMLSLLKKLNRK